MSILCQENMLPKLELPFDYSPMAKMYHGCAFPLGIISANAKTDITPWLIGKYINCMYVGWWNNKFSYYFDDSWMRNDGILILQRIHLTHSSFRNIYGNMDIVNLFRKMISLGFYPTDYYDEFYIPGKVLYGTSHYRHDFLLTGYDDEKSCFISAGYLSDNVFQRFEIPYDNMRQAFYQVSDTHITCNFWKYNQEAKYELNLKDVSRFLSDYISSTCSVEMPQNRRSYGWNAIEDLSKCILYLYTNYQQMDVRFTRGIMEHKQFMLMRIKHLYSVGVLKDSDFVEKAQRVYKKATVVHNLGIKIMLHPNDDSVNRLCDLISELNEMEKQYLPEVLSQIQEAEVNDNV